MAVSMRKLDFEVEYFTSESDDHPASQLNTINPDTKGWHSERFCSWPQEVGIKILDGEVKICQLQVLSHQYKIAKKIEVFVGRGRSYDTADFKRLGYLSLDSNESSNFQARELKTVFVDTIGSYVKFVIGGCYANKANTYSQVGIVAINLQGTDIGAEAEEKSPVRDLERPTAKQPYKNPYNDLSVEIALDPQTTAKLRQLADAKQKAVENEDYVTAKSIKSVEQELKKMGSELAQLEAAKRAAVDKEDYDMAKDLKDQCDVMRKEIDRKIRNVQIPGVRLPAASPPISKQTPKFAPPKDDDRGEDELNIKPSSGAGMNIDDLPVGAGSSKRVAKVEVIDYSNDVTGADASHNHVEDDFSHLDIMERPIKPKARPAYDDLEHMNDPSNIDGGQLTNNVPVEKFPPGEHPLEGMPNFTELPTPEQLNAKNREFCEVNGITKLIGEYRCRCLFSKVWTVREAVMMKIQQMIRDEIRTDIANHVQATCGILKTAAEDKIQQVLFASLGLMEQFLGALRSAKASKSACGPHFEQVINQLIEKLSDGNARLREGAKKGLDMIAASPQVGPAIVANYVVKVQVGKLKTGWRPLQSRISLLADLTTNYGINSSSGLNYETMLKFAKDCGAYAHSSGEVRDAAKDMVVAIQKHVGTPPLEPTLSLLRKKQREEYEAAFKDGGVKKADEKPSSRQGAAAEKANITPTHANNASPSRRTDMTHQHATHYAGGKVPTSSARTQDRGNGYEPAKEESGDKAGQDFTSCMFCSMQNRNWTENDLDLHYWKDCPLLISCPSCAQIVEIAGLPEHLLDECDAKGSYVPCDVTGLAIRKQDYDAWRKSPQCVPAPENCLYCPLCYSCVEDSDQAWLGHLTRECAKNTRIRN